MYSKIWKDVDVFHRKTNNIAGSFRKVITYSQFQLKERETSTLSRLIGNTRTKYLEENIIIEDSKFNELERFPAKDYFTRETPHRVSFFDWSILIGSLVVFLTFLRVLISHSLDKTIPFFDITTVLLLIPAIAYAGVMYLIILKDIEIYKSKNSKAFIYENGDKISVLESRDKMSKIKLY